MFSMHNHSISSTWQGHTVHHIGDTSTHIVICEQWLSESD